MVFGGMRIKVMVILNWVKTWINTWSINFFNIRSIEERSCLGGFGWMDSACREVFIEKFVQLFLFTRGKGIDLATLRFEVRLKMNGVIIVRVRGKLVKSSFEENVLKVPIFFWNKRFHIFFRSCSS